MGIRDILDRAGDMFMPKELAPYAGTLATMFAPQLGIPISMALGQLGSAKMNDGKLDPYVAASTLLAGNTTRAKEIRAAGRTGQGGGNLSQKLGGGIANVNIGDQSLSGKSLGNMFDPTKVSFGENAGTTFSNEGAYRSIFDKDFNPANMKSDYNEFNFKPKGEGVFDFGGEFDYIDPDTETFFKSLSLEQKEKIVKESGLDGSVPFDELTKSNQLNIANTDTFKEAAAARKVGDTNNLGILNQLGTSAGDTILPGFTNDKGKIDFGKALTTISAATAVSQIMPLAEELKKQKALDKAEEGKIWKEWFDGYKRVSGRDYINSPYPDPTLIEKYKQFMATGGRVGYNTGGDTGIIAAAPGMPEGMQLDGRDGMFISQGVAEKADDVPAMLSKNEFVLTADAMKGFDKMTGGDGNPRSAAQKMYEMMNQMEAIA